MFEGLTERLGGVFDRLSGRGVLGEKDIDEALERNVALGEHLPRVVARSGKVRVQLVEAKAAAALNLEVEHEVFAKPREVGGGER